MSPNRSISARVNAAWLAFLGSIALFGVLVALLIGTTEKSSPRGEPLVVYCAAVDSVLRRPKAASISRRIFTAASLTSMSTSTQRSR